MFGNEVDHAVVTAGVLDTMAGCSSESHTVACVSVGLEKFSAVWTGCARSFKSRRNNPLLVRFNWKLFLSLVACKV